MRPFRLKEALSPGVCCTYGGPLPADTGEQAEQAPRPALLTLCREANFAQIITPGGVEKTCS